MANKKISQLVVLSSGDVNVTQDFLPITDHTDSTKKINLANIPMLDLIALAGFSQQTGVVTIDGSPSGVVLLTRPTGA